MGAERALPDRLLGFNTPANNLIPFEDPAFAPAVKALGPALMRFPGGTVSNYYNWRTGQLDIARGTDAQVVRNLFRQVAENSLKIHPKGVFWDDFHRFAEAAGAECVCCQPEPEPGNEGPPLRRHEAGAHRRAAWSSARVQPRP